MQQIQTEQLTIPKITKILGEQLPHLTKKYHVKTLSLFGSYVHNQQNKNSDLDILVTFSQTPCLFTFIELQYYLTDLLGIEVDLAK